MNANPASTEDRAASRSRGRLAEGLSKAARQLRESAAPPLPALLAASAGLGAAVIVGLDAGMRPNAIAAHLNSVITYVILRELAPLIVVLALALRSGAALVLAIGLDGAGEGGGRGASAVIPRAAGLIVASLALTASVAAAALLGGFAAVNVLGASPVGVRLGSLIASITAADAAVSLGKAAVGGVIISAVGAALGGRISKKGGPPERLAQAAGDGALQCALGSFVALAALSIALVGWGRRDAADAEGGGGDFIVRAASVDAYGTRVGASVKVRGVEVGSVTDVSLARDPARLERPVLITMRINRHAASFLFDRTVAHIERIQMGPGIPPFAVPPIELRTGGDEPLAPGSTLLAVGDETMTEAFVQLSRDVKAVRTLLDGLGDTLGDLRTITKALARTDGAAGRFINDPTTADDMSAMLDGARGATSSLQKLLVDARALSGQAGPLLAEMQGASKDGRDALAGAAGAARDLPRILRSAERTLKLAEELIVNLRAASVYAPELARKVDASLEETNRVVDAAQKSLILRNTVPDRLSPRTEEEVRPPAPVSPAGDVE